MENKILIQYYRDKKGNPIGVVIAIAPGILGWSLCHVKATENWTEEIGWESHPADKFDKKLAIHIALERAEKANVMSTIQRSIYYNNKVPQSLNNLFKKMMEKSERYYK